ncbi:hypothetical protein SAMN04488535_1166 [Corynebacterium mycetoides]|uniref:Winged helix DNA-binding domain-containing protein n=1 Tax=Corynebacterium mycetoides TaxID=38302 RepID=A0A1G9NUR3_9CORY|nr:hypothetical protein [Corynebacterium mycetoides]SDL89767.1 hypothetical protein SAMN04488535_1166 [Corynebacterium mycetoides]
MIDSVLLDLDALKVCAALDAAGATEGTGGGSRREMSAATIADITRLAPDVVDARLGVLEGAGYATLFREIGRAGTTAWASLTVPGMDALNGHVESLREYAAGE